MSDKQKLANRGPDYRILLNKSTPVHIFLHDLNPKMLLTFFKKNGPNPASFWFYFRSFSQHKDKYSTNFTINNKSIDGVLGS